MSDDEFLGMTLRRWMALLKCKRDAEARQGRLGEFMLGQLTALVRNFGLGENQEPAKATDFMPSEWMKERRPKNRSRKDRLADMEQQRMMWRAMAMQSGTFVAAKPKVT